MADTRARLSLRLRPGTEGTVIDGTEGTVIGGGSVTALSGIATESVSAASGDGGITTTGGTLGVGV
jgi:hypothetical protein